MAAPTASSYPASFALDPPERIANWRPLLQWLLAIPHLVILYALQLVSEVCGFISWVAILVTGKNPEGLAGIQVMYLRYSMRVWSYVGFQVEEYPPFSFSTAGADPGDYGRVRVDFQPQLEGRNRLTVLIRFLMVIPQVIVLFFVWVAAFVVILIAFFAVLFTGRWPEGMWTFVLGAMRWQVRANAYMYLLTDEYPPFSLD